MPVDYAGKGLVICINGEYVLEFLEACSKPTITVKIRDESSAMLLEEGDDHVAVIMPMKGR